jgi:hypothetical protein
MPANLPSNAKRTRTVSLTVVSLLVFFWACAEQEAAEDSGLAAAGRGGSGKGGAAGAGGLGGSSASRGGSGGSGGTTGSGGTSLGSGGEGASASATSSGGSGSSGGTGSSGSAGTSGGGGELGFAGSGSCAEPSEAGRTTARCGSTWIFEGQLYQCISQDKNSNGEPTGCGTFGARCSEIDPDHPGWGTTAWALVDDCSGSGGAGGVGGAGGGSEGGGGSGGA